MKKIIITTIALIISLAGIAQEEMDKFSFSIKNWDLKIVGLESFYPTYMADPLGVRFEISSQNIFFSDFEYEDRINEGEGYLGRLMIVPGMRLSAFKFSPKSNPKLGVEVDLGVITPVSMRHGNHDLIAIDGVYYFAISGRPTEWLSLRFSKHHICTHLGDEYYSGKIYSPTDYDPMISQLPVRDDFIFSAAVEPLYFLKIEEFNILEVYMDIGFFLPGVDFLGERQNKPNRKAWMNYQGGMQLEYSFRKKYFGGVYSAINVSAYQLNAFSPNISVSGGYIFPQEVLAAKFRMGISYYNGRSLLNQFYNRKERFIAFQIAADF